MSIERKQQDLKMAGNVSKGVSIGGILYGLFVDCTVGLIAAAAGITGSCISSAMEQNLEEKKNKYWQSGKLICPQCNRACGDCNHTEDEIIEMIDQKLKQTKK